MQLTLEDVGYEVGRETWLYPLTLALEPGAVTVLLGATQAGKTTLMRLMAGLDTPTRGRVRVDGQDVTGVPVRRRQVAMVYQQFINYPSMTVYDNIASPLKLARATDVDARVRGIAAKLHIEPYLQRLPAELSGGQQQRVALARALAKAAPLMLLDEPLVNLDYKLREGLRDELAQWFAQGEATVVYATTEPGEALLLGGHTAVLDAGELLQYGPTAEVFHLPASLRVARAFSDPPMNLLDGSALPPAWQHPGQTVGLRANHLRLHERAGDLRLDGRVELAEIAGSETYLHASTALGEVVAQLPGVHTFELGAPVTLFARMDDAYVFDAAAAGGRLSRAPERLQGA